MHNCWWDQLFIRSNKISPIARVHKCLFSARPIPKQCVNLFREHRWRERRKVGRCWWCLVSFLITINEVYQEMSLPSKKHSCGFLRMNERNTSLKGQPLKQSQKTYSAHHQSHGPMNACIFGTFHRRRYVVLLCERRMVIFFKPERPQTEFLLEGSSSIKTWRFWQILQEALFVKRLLYM